MPSAYTILFIIIVIIAILTWIIPAGTYTTDKAGNIISGTYKAVSSKPQGIWDVFMAPVIGMVGDKKTEGAISVSLFILVIGGWGLSTRLTPLMKGSARLSGVTRVGRSN